MGSIHNDLHTWAYKARRRGLATIEISVETADRACEKIVELSNRVMDLEHALRAQPQAREDVQPVAWRWRVGDDTPWCPTDREPKSPLLQVQPLYTHPAPDALRVAVEALKAAGRAISAQYALAQAEYQHLDHLATKHDKIVQEGRRAIREALATLQAEVTK